MRTDARFISWTIRSGQVLIITLILAVAQYAVQTGLVGDLYLAAPSQIVVEFLALLNDFELFRHLWTTLNEFFVGFVISGLLGVGLGVILARVRVAEKFSK